MVVCTACIEQGLWMKMKWGMLKVARERKTRAPEVPGLSKTREVQSLEDFGLKTLLKSSIEHLYADQRLTNAREIAEGTTMHLQRCLQNSKLPVADTKLSGGKFLLVFSNHRV